MAFKRHIRHYWFLYLFVLLIFCLLVHCACHSFVVLSALEKSTVYAPSHEAHSTLRVLQHKVFSSEVLTYLTTLIIALLVTLGVFFMQRFRDMFARQQEMFSGFETKDKTLQGQSNIHLPLMSVCSLVQSMAISFDDKESLSGEDEKAFYRLCYYIQRGIEWLNDLLPKSKYINNDYQEFLVNVFMRGLIEDFEKLVKKDGNKDYPLRILRNLQRIRTEIQDKESISY